MNICFFADSLAKTGGAEWQTWLIAKGFAELGHRAVFIALKAPVSRPESKISKDVLIIHIPKRYNILRKLLFTAEILKEKKINICYIRTINYLYALGFLCSLKGIPFVFNFYSLLFCMKSWPKELTRIHKQISGNKVYLRYARKNMMVQFNRKILNRASGVIVQTQEQKDLLFKNFAVKSAVVPNMWPVLNHPSHTESGEKKTVLWVGKQFKRPEVFLDLALNLKNREDIQFIMVGRLDKNSRNYVEIYNKINKAENIKHHEWLPRERVSELFKNACLYVNTSCIEGFPNTFLEAWSSFTPVVSLHVDPDHVLVNKSAGMYSGKFKKLIQDVKFLLDHPDERKRIAQKGWLYLNKHHNPKNIIKDYESFFDRIILNYHSV